MLPRNHIGPTHEFPRISTAGVARFDAIHERCDLVEDLPALLHEAGDLVHGVDDGGVVTPPELPGDGGIAVVGELAGHVHPDLTGLDERPAPAGATQLVDAESEGLGCGLEDDLGGDLA